MSGLRRHLTCLNCGKRLTDRQLKFCGVDCKLEYRRNPSAKDSTAQPVPASVKRARRK